MSSSIKRNIVTGFLWSVFGQVGYLGVAFITNILLVRILGPYEFGQIGIIMFFVAIGKVLTESGLSGALVRKNDATEEDFSTVFIFNLIISFVLVAVIIVMSGYVADFYKDTSLENILIVSSMVLLIDAFRIPQNAKLVKELKFKKKAAYEFTAIFFSAIIAVILAIKGAGVWAIVTMQLLTAILLTSLLWIFEGSLNQFVFRKKSFLALYKFGVNTTLASILNTAFDNIYQLILGKYFSVNLTGLFYQGKKLQEIPVGVIKSTTLGVVFASLSKVQHDITEFGNLYKRIITLFTIVVGLICLLVYYYAENIILLLYGKEWIEAVFFVQILIISSFFYLQEIFNRVIFKVFDKTEKILYLEVLKKCIQAATIIIGVIFMDIELLLYGFLFTSVVSYLINYYVSRKVYNSFSWHEVVLIAKVVFLAVLTMLLAHTIQNLIRLEGYLSFTLIPIILVIYFLGVKFLKITNIIKELFTIKRLLKND